MNLWRKNMKKTMSLIVATAFLLTSAFSALALNRAVVDVPDPALKKALNTLLNAKSIGGKTDRTDTDALDSDELVQLADPTTGTKTPLNLAGLGIKDLTGINSIGSTETVDLSNTTGAALPNDITDVTALASVTGIKYAILSGNANLTDITPIKDLDGGAVANCAVTDLSMIQAGVSLSANAQKVALPTESIAKDTDYTFAIPEVKPQTGETITKLTVKLNGTDVSTDVSATNVNIPHASLNEGDNTIEVSWEAGSSFDGTMTKTLKVLPASAPTFTVTIDPATNGTATVDKTTAAEGETVTVTTTPESGYVLDTITMNGTAITGNSFLMPGENVTLVVTFKVAHTVVVNTNVTNGNITMDKTEAGVGDTVTLTVNAAEGYQLKEGSLKVMTASGTEVPLTAAVTRLTNGSFTFVMPAEAVTVLAEFEAIPVVSTPEAPKPPTTEQTNPEEDKKPTNTGTNPTTGTAGLAGVLGVIGLAGATILFTRKVNK